MYRIQEQFGLSKLVDEAGPLSLVHSDAALFDVVVKAGRTGLKARKAPADTCIFAKKPCLSKDGAHHVSA